MIRISMRIGGRRDELEYVLPITEADLWAARRGCAAWMRANPMSPLDGAWGVQIETGFIRPSVPWYKGLSDFDRIIALHAIADKYCRVVKD